MEQMLETRRRHSWRGTLRSTRGQSHVQSGWYQPSRAWGGGREGSESFRAVVLFRGSSLDNVGQQEQDQLGKVEDEST